MFFVSAEPWLVSAFNRYPAKRALFHIIVQKSGSIFCTMIQILPAGAEAEGAAKGVAIAHMLNATGDIGVAIKGVSAVGPFIGAADTNPGPQTFEPSFILLLSCRGFVLFCFVSLSRHSSS